MSLAWLVVSQTGKRAGGGVKLSAMRVSRSALFRGRHFEIIVLCLPWYLRYPLS